MVTLVIPAGQVSAEGGGAGQEVVPGGETRVPGLGWSKMIMRRTAP